MLNNQNAATPGAKRVTFELSQANVEEWQLELFFVHFKGVELDERRGGHFHYHFQPATHMGQFLQGGKNGRLMSYFF